MKLKALILFFFFSLFSISYSQSADTLLPVFEVIKVSSGIQLNWTVKGGNTCSGIEIYHSTDSVHFTKIYDYPGVCGNSTGNQSYNWVHTSPKKNSGNFYKLYITNYNHYSLIASLFYINFSENKYYIFPQPATSSATLYFENENSEKFNFFLYNSAGHEVQKAQNINGTQIIINRPGLAAGSYIFKLVNAEGKEIKGKLVFE